VLGGFKGSGKRNDVQRTRPKCMGRPAMSVMLGCLGAAMVVVAAARRGMRVETRMMKFLRAVVEDEDEEVEDEEVEVGG
jgi:hypothetical protein